MIFTCRCCVIGEFEGGSGNNNGNGNSDGGNHGNNLGNNDETPGGGNNQGNGPDWPYTGGYDYRKWLNGIGNKGDGKNGQNNTGKLIYILYKCPISI